MTAEKIYDFLNKKFPVSSAAEYDNTGFLIGDKTADVKSAVLALDCTDTAIDLCIKTGANLIITHHPVIFNGIKSINKGDTVYRLIENEISVISMHTNLDMGEGGVCDALAHKLSLKSISVINGYDGLSFRKGVLNEHLSADDFAKFVSERLNTTIKYVGSGKSVSTVAVCSGSGSDYMYDAINSGCDAFVTSEVKHHLFLEAEKAGLVLIDAGHFSTEDVIIEPLCQLLRNEFPSVTFITDHNSVIKVMNKI